MEQLRAGSPGSPFRSSLRYAGRARKVPIGPDYVVSREPGKTVLRTFRNAEIAYLDPPARALDCCCLARPDGLSTLWRRRLVAVASAAVFAPTTSRLRAAARASRAGHSHLRRPVKERPREDPRPPTARIIYIDDKLIAEGTFVGDSRWAPTSSRSRASARRALRAARRRGRRGREPIYAHITSTVSTTNVGKGRPEGIYGGRCAAASHPGGTGNSLERSATTAEQGRPLTSCTAGSGLGAPGLGGFVGYHWDPVGIRALPLRRLRRPHRSSVGVGPTLGGIQNNPRATGSTIRRAGASSSRIRLTKQWRKGPAVAADRRRRRVPRDDALARREGEGSAERGRLVQLGRRGPTWSPAIRLEPTVAYRLTRASP